MTVLPLTVQDQQFIGPLTELMTYHRKLRNSIPQMEVPDQTTHSFQELFIDQMLEQYTVILPDEAHQLVFEFLEMSPPPREHENAEGAKNIRLRLATSKDKQKMLWEIQRQWCQPALRKVLLANINNYDRRELIPPLDEGGTSSDEEDSYQTTSYKDIKPYQPYNPPYPYSHITSQSPILTWTMNIKDKEETWRRIQNGLKKHRYCYLKLFNDDEIGQMIDDGIILEETISRSDLADLADYQETDRYVYTIIYNPAHQVMIHLQTTEDYTTTGEQYLTKYNLTALCRATTDDHIIGMQVKAANHTFKPLAYKPETEHKRPPSPHKPMNKLNNLFTKIEQRPNLDQKTKTLAMIKQENTDLQTEIDKITCENATIKSVLDDADSRKLMSSDNMIIHPPAWFTPPRTPEHEEKPQSPTMEQEGEVKENTPIVETDEEDEEEFQKNLEEVRIKCQHDRAQEKIWDRILRQNEAFKIHCNVGPWTFR